MFNMRIKYKGAAFALLLLSSVSECHATEGDWGYSGHNGPDGWGQLSPEYSTCKTGENQSPVDISDVKDTHAGPVPIRFSSKPVVELNNGHTVQVDDNGGDTLLLDNQSFRLKQFHFHTPSEHTFKGKVFPMEIHFVHQNAQGDIAVVAVMVRVGKENTELKKLWQHIPANPESQTSVKSQVDLRKLFPVDLSYYRYSGSLTTPPCSEGVRWLVIRQTITASEQQIKTFTAVMHHPNNRPLQPLHGRVIVD